MEYKKSYLGIIIWIICFTAAYIGCAFLPFKDDNMHLMIAVMNNVMTVSIFLLMLIIYKTEYVYWFTGITYEQADKAGSERRKAYAAEHMKRFGYLTLAFAAYTCISLYLNVSYVVDMIVVFVGLIATAFSTNRIKL